MTGAKALRYAEETLGVHQVYQDAKMAREYLDTVLTELSKARDARRDTERDLHDLEMMLTLDERSKNPELSVAAFERHLKDVLWQNEPARRLRHEIHELASSIDGLEMDIKMAETDVRIAVSRMQELGGLLQFLAAIKLSSNTTEETGEASD